MAWNMRLVNSSVWGLTSPQDVGRSKPRSEPAKPQSLSVACTNQDPSNEKTTNLLCGVTSAGCLPAMESIYFSLRQSASQGNDVENHLTNHRQTWTGRPDFQPAGRTEMEIMRNNVFTVRLADADFDTSTNGWRCQALIVPGTKVRSLFANGSEIDSSKFRVPQGEANILWLLPSPPPSVSVVIELTEELSLDSDREKWKRRAVVLPVISGLIAVFVPLIWPMIISNTPFSTDQARWIHRQVRGDWSGHDVASTESSYPVNILNSVQLCNKDSLKKIAICWTDRAEGYPKDVLTDIKGKPPAWCAYKDSYFNVNSIPNGTAPQADLYECSLKCVCEV